MSYQCKSVLNKVLVTDLHLISSLLVGCTVNSYKEEKKLFCSPGGDEDTVSDNMGVRTWLGVIKDLKQYEHCLFAFSERGHN